MKSVAFALLALAGGALGDDRCRRINDAALCNSIDFDSDFTPSNSEWKVENNAIVESSARDNTPRCGVGASGSFNLFDAAAVDDQPTRTINTRVKVDSADGTAGVIFQYLDEKNYCVLHLGPQCRKVIRFHEDGDGVAQETELMSASSGYSIRPNEWYTVQLMELDSNNFGLHLILESSNSELTSFFQKGDDDWVEDGNKGRFGLYCSNGRDCTFDDVAVVATPKLSELEQASAARCASCDVTWPHGTRNWCRCCGLRDCGYNYESCVSDGMCASVCKNSGYCPIGEATPLPEDPPSEEDPEEETGGLDPDAGKEGDEPSSNECVLSDWSEWGPCSATCDDEVTPTKSRARRVISGNCLGQHLRETRGCNENVPCEADDPADLTPEELSVICNCASCSVSTHFRGSASWCRCCKSALKPQCGSAPQCANSVFEGEGCLSAGYGSEVCLGGDTPSGTPPPSPPPATPTVRPTPPPTEPTPAPPTPSYTHCNCASCSIDNHFAGSAAWCRCCAMAQIEECASASKCSNNVFEADGCIANDFEGRCGPLITSPGFAVDDAETAAAKQAQEEESLLGVMIAFVVTAVLSLLVSAVLAFVIFSQNADRKAAAAPPPPPVRSGSRDIGRRSYRSAR